MKKSIIFALTTLLLTSIAPISAGASDFTEEITYPYKPSEIVRVFEQNYMDQYDQINDDLHANNELAQEWAEDAVPGKFNIYYADGIEVGYDFKYISKSLPNEMFWAFPTLEGLWNSVIDPRDGDIYYGIANVNLTLRKLIPAMLNDERLLHALNRLTLEGANTGIWITLRNNEEGKLMWYIEFRIDKEGLDHPDFLVRVSAGDLGKPYFMATQMKRQ